MTDLWCFTCGHEVKRKLLSLRPSYEHEDPGDEEGCVCAEDDLECEPR